MVILEKTRNLVFDNNIQQFKIKNNLCSICNIKTVNIIL